MKLKQDPADFQVEELTSVRPGDDGEFAYYRLEKRNWTTPDAISAIRRRWQLHVHRVSYGGLKDRHAATIQYITIYRGPRRNFGQPGIRLTWLGQVREPFSAQAIDANRFRITVRDLSAEHADAARTAAPLLARDGVPNYFDDQRFGSVGDEREFVAKRMVLGDFEGALKLALAAPYEFDRAEARREKAILREHWGNWKECKDRLPRGHARSLVDYLVHHPADFRGAAGRLRPDLQGLYLSAFQSHLWNAILGAWLRESLPAGRLLELDLRLGPVPAPGSLDDQERARWHGAKLALPAARWKLDPNEDWAPAATQVLAAEGLAWDQIRIKGLQKPFFTKGERAAWCIPGEFSLESADDERHPGRTALKLSFALPRGSYATMVIKRLIAMTQ